jgi:alginate O-acetyltransferase complex protein AlgI
MGLFKKVMIADHVAIFTYSVFEHTGDMSDISLIEAWIGSLGYTFQLYFDFSGYSDMACGLALCFGITLPINFNSPYKALNISDFWKRWHISLSNWFMSYFYTTIYIKWGRVHFPKSSPYILPILTMTFIGIWHGSGYTFIACGLLHGILLCLHQAYKNTKLSRHFHHNKIYSLFCWSLTFLATVHSIVFFRAKDLEQSFDIFNAMWLKNGIGIPYHIYFRYESWLSPLSKPDYVWLSPPNFLFWFALCSCLCFFSPNSQSWFTQGPIKKLSWKPSPIFAIISAALLASSLFSMTKESEFLYFQF